MDMIPKHAKEYTFNSLNKVNSDFKKHCIDDSISVFVFLLPV